VRESSPLEYEIRYENQTKPTRKFKPKKFQKPKPKKKKKSKSKSQTQTQQEKKIKT
jgi:hypothetical protein